MLIEWYGRSILNIKEAFKYHITCLQGDLNGKWVIWRGGGVGKGAQWVSSLQIFEIHAIKSIKVFRNKMQREW